MRCNSDVAEDVVMAGSVVDLFGNVGDDARLAGSMVTIGGNVEDDLIVFGAMIRVLPGTVVKGDITSLGGSIIIDGKTEGNLLAYGGQVIINGQVGGSAMIEAEEVVIGKSADIAGVMQYKAVEEAEIPAEAQIAGGVEYSILEKDAKLKWDKKKKDELSAGAMFGMGLIAFLFKVLIGIVTVLVALYFFKKRLLEMTKIMLTAFPAQLGWGFVWAVVVPVACIVLIFTIFGSTLGFFGLLLYALTLLVAKALAMIAFGAWIWKLATKAKTIELDWKIAVLGVVILDIIWLIPILGWIFCMIFTLAALGAVMNYLKQAVK